MEAAPHLCYYDESSPFMGRSERRKTTMRSFWTGAISFGLIYIPVKLYNASETQELSFNLLRRSDRSRIKYVRISSATGEEVPNDELVKGYEFAKGEYVVLEDEDFKRANVKKTQTIEIVTFVDASQVDYKLYEKPSS